MTQTWTRGLIGTSLLISIGLTLVMITKIKIKLQGNEIIVITTKKTLILSVKNISSVSLPQRLRENQST